MHQILPLWGFMREILMHRNVEGHAILTSDIRSAESKMNIKKAAGTQWIVIRVVSDIENIIFDRITEVIK